MSERKNVEVNAIFNIIKSCNQILFPLITFPYISRVLQPENVGKITFGDSIISYYTLLASLGVSVYAIRECAKVREDREQLSKTSSEIFSINIVMMTVSYIILTLMLFLVKTFEPYRSLIFLQSTIIFFNIIGAEWLNTAMEDFKFITIRTFVFQLLGACLMFLLVHEPEDYYIYVCINIVVTIGINMSNFFYRKRYCEVRFTPHLNLKTHLRPIMTVFSLILSQTIYTNSDVTVIGLFRTEYEVGLYSTAVRLYNLVNTVVASIALVIIPQISHFFAIKDYKEVNRLLRYATNFTLVLGLPCVVGLNVVAEEVILIIAGEGYLGAAIVLRILTIALLISLIGGIVSNIILIPSNKEHICMKASIVSAIVNLVGNVVFVPMVGIGAAAVTTVVSQAVGLVITSKHIDENVKLEGVFHMLRGPIVGCIGIILVSFVVKLIFEGTVVVFLVTVFFSVVVYAMALFGLKNELVVRMLESIKK